MDRFEAHTRHCRSCRRAHRRLRLWRPRLLAAAVALPLLALLLPAFLPGALVLAALLALAARQMGRWQRGLEQGSGEPPRNRD